MAIHLAKSSSVLEPYIKHYWSIDQRLLEGEKYIHRIIPCGISELMFYLEPKPVVIDPRKDFSESVVLSGHQKEFFDLQIENKISLFSIAFQPEGLMEFFNIPLIEVYNQNIPLKFIDKKLEQELFPKIQSANSFEDRVEIANAHFIQLLSKNQSAFEFKRISHIVKTIKTSKGLIDVESLSNEACLSRKQFERVFTKHIGSTPKQYLKTVRLQHSLHLKSKDKDKSLTQLAYDCGYYDQSHFINEFKQQTGHTPKQYFNNYDSFSDFFDG
jgi:AraC-like DNA-binding protein